MKVLLTGIGIFVLIIFLVTPSAWNPLTPKGEIVGFFVKGGHHGYGDECGQYPGSWIHFKNATYNKDHWYKHYANLRTYFGNQFKDIDNMKEGTLYRVWYHEGSRQSDVSASYNIYYWVIDGYETL